MGYKICPLMSRVILGGWSKEEQRYTNVPINEVMCLEGRCQLWEGQTETCSLATEGFLAGRAAVMAEMRGEREGGVE